ncbi:MAG: hypothetical protein SF182_12065 [Deltaproteobacteria bacterium]|nr:hypothetical protein [Deltaproteobacteria bacterium]
MRTHPRFTHLAALLLCCAAVAACKKEEAPPPAPATAPAAPQAAAPAAFAVTSLDLGKQLGPDKKVTESLTVFAAGDTIYASVGSTGASPNVALKARWTYEEDGQLVNESVQTIAPTGPAVTEFHIGKPSGWPPGKYKVVISANDQPVQSKMYEVK